MHRFRTTILLLLLLLTAALLGACAGSPEDGRVRSTVAEAMAGGDDDAGFARATEPKEFVFPRDHGPHEEFRTEWWYYTGNLEDANGNPFGYQLTFFRSALAPDQPERISDRAANDVYMVHFAVTDARAGEHYSFDRYARGDGELAGATGEPIYQVWLDDWSATEFEPGKTQLIAATSAQDGESVAIDLLLEQTVPPILHGDRGLSQKGEEVGNANYYYSIPRMATSGTVTIDGRAHEVSGLSWKDHEYGTSALSDDTRGWDWFAIQLDNGANIMLAELHDGFGENRFVMEGSMVDGQGRQITLTDADFDLRALGEWTSPRTNITYPSGWEIVFPNEQIELTIMPLIEDQEMDISFVYYEGATEVTGTVNGEPVTGRGYVELTGYGDRQMAEYQR